jgi:6-pyruvoyl-tetrahydropterin synthase
VRFWISRDFTFTASHEVDLGDGHRCSARHEHQFTVRVRLGASLDQRSMVLDFNELDSFADALRDRYDGRYLNDQFRQPTSERIALRLMVDLHSAVPAAKAMHCSIGVSESPGVWAWCGDE